MDIPPFFDAIGRVPSADIRVTLDGTLQEFGFRYEELAPVNTCLNAALEGAELPTVYPPDASSNHVGSWSIGDQDQALCLAAGQAHPLVGATWASDAV